MPRGRLSTVDGYSGPILRYNACDEPANDKYPIRDVGLMSDHETKKRPGTQLTGRPGGLDTQSELVRGHYDLSAVALPQTYVDGQGTTGFLMDWHATTPRGVAVKRRPEVLAEFFTSMLVLSAQFKYRPAIGTRNYLYYVDDEWRLSLIAPEQWSDAHRAGFAGVCELHPDRTWTIEPSAQLTTDTPVADAVRRFYDGFRAAMDTDGTLEDILPFHAGKFSYHQRVNANALSRSLRASIILGDQRETPLHEWALKLPRMSKLLPARNDD